MPRRVEWMVTMAFLFGAITVLAENAPDVPRETGPLRLSAIVSSGSRYYAGFVDTANGQAHLVPQGGKVLNWHVKLIDEHALTATLTDEDGRDSLVVLTGDEQLAAEVLASQQAPRIKTLEEFLAEHPDLATSPAEQIPMEFPLSTNSAFSYEDFMAAHPQWKGMTNYVAPELLNSDGLPPAALSGAEAAGGSVSREEGLRRMAEQTGMPVPADAETTYEEFLQRNAPVGVKPVAAP